MSTLHLHHVLLRRSRVLPTRKSLHTMAKPSQGDEPRLEKI